MSRIHWQVTPKRVLCFGRLAPSVAGPGRLLGVVAEGDPNVVESQSWPGRRDASNAI